MKPCSSNKLRKKTRLAGALALLVFVLATAAQAQDAEAAGTVVAVSGEWFLDGKTSEKITLNRQIPIGSTVQARSPNAKYGHIAIRMPNGMTISRTCDRAGECGDPIVLSKEIDRSTRLKPPPKMEASYIGRVRKKASQNPKRYESTISRGSRNPKDSVVELTGGKIDLSPAFKGLEKESYLLRFEPMDRVGKPGGKGSFEPLPFRWDPDKQSPIEMRGLAPGLFRISLLDVDTEEHEPTGTNIWILVSDESEYARVSASFQQAIDITGTWSKGIKPDPDSFLRAYLEMLAAASAAPKRSAKRKN